MSAIIVLTPLIIGGWSTFGPAIVGALGVMGYAAVKDKTATMDKASQICEEMALNIENSQVVTERMGLDETLVFRKDEITLQFFKDARGKCGIKVLGPLSKIELEKLGEEISQRVVQHYMYNKPMDELKKKNYHVLEEREESDETIRIRVRRWEG